MNEQPICKVTPIALAGVNARTHMDEKSPVSDTLPNGKTVWGYEVNESAEHVPHVRISAIGDPKVKWIRISERDNSNPLVKITYLVDPSTEIATSLTQVAQTQQTLAQEVHNLVTAMTLMYSKK